MANGPSVSGPQPSQAQQVQEIASAGGGAPDPAGQLQQAVMSAAQQLGPQQTAQMLQDIAQQVAQASPDAQAQAQAAAQPQVPPRR